jgi:hypothetical protein
VKKWTSDGPWLPAAKMQSLMPICFACRTCSLKQSALRGMKPGPEPEAASYREKSVGIPVYN